MLSLPLLLLAIWPQLLGSIRPWLSSPYFVIDFQYTYSLPS